MKSIGLIFAICLVTFVVSSIFFALQSRAEIVAVAPYQPTRTALMPYAEEGVVLSAETSATEYVMPEIEVQSDPLSLLRTLPHTSQFVALLENTGVADALSADATYTFFVPVNSAFASLPKGSSVYGTAEERLRFAKYHIVIGKMMSLDSVKAGNIRMFSGDYLNQMVFETPVTESTAHVIATYRVKNGIVYLIDTALPPPERRPFPFQ